MQTIEAVLEQLNTYDGDNIWQDVVEGLDYDRQATEDVDPNYESADIIIHGHHIAYVGGSWVNLGKHEAGQ